MCAEQSAAWFGRRRRWTRPALSWSRRGWSDPALSGRRKQRAERSKIRRETPRVWRRAMSKWLALARGGGVSIVPLVPIAQTAAPIGTNGTIGTAVEIAPECAATDPTGANGTIGTAPPISAEEVEAAAEWAVLRLRSDRGLSCSEAEDRAVELVRGELLNDARLVPEQPNPTRCLVCGGPNAIGNPLVPVLTPIKDRHLWLHLEDCHAEHLKRQAKKADALLASSL